MFRKKYSINDIDSQNEKMDNSIRHAKAYDNISQQIIKILLIIFLIFILSALYEMFKFNAAGLNTVKYLDFDELRKTNPDIVGWIRIYDTHIDHPVVHGKDNFEYLDKDFYGNFYAGGTIFQDYKNKKDFSDPYNIIHGHHMAGGAMFGDLGKFNKPKFFDEHKEGELLTPKYDYDLKIIGVATVNAYNGKVYNVKVKTTDVPYNTLMNAATFKRTYIKIGDAQLLTLTTCSGEMNDNRTVVFCKMINRGEHG